MKPVIEEDAPSYGPQGLSSNIMKKKKEIIENHQTFFSKFSEPAVWLAIIGLFIGLVQYNRNSLRERKSDTVHYLQELHNLLDNTDPELLEIINVYGTKGKDYMISRDSLDLILRQNHIYKKQLEDLMIAFNQFAIGCQEGFYDEKTAWVANYQLIVDVTKALVPYFEIIEKERGYNGEQYVCWFLRNMAFRWENDTSIGNKYNKLINRKAKETKRKVFRDENYPKFVVIKRKIHKTVN